MNSKGAIFRGEDLMQYSNYLKVFRKCIICGSKNFKKWAQTGPIKAVKCNKCGLIWMRPFLNSEGLSLYYNNHLGQRRLNHEAKMRQRFLQYKEDKKFIERFVSIGKVLDVGCNGGFFLSVLDKKFKKYGIEIDPVAVEYAQKKFDFGKRVECIPLEKVPFGSEYFDLIIMRGTLEHLPDPILAIEKVSKLLKQNGLFYITATPNGASFSAEIYKENWNLFHPIQHIWHFNPNNLEKVCGRFGLSLLASDFPYLGTPYEDVENDILAVAKTIKLKRGGKKNKRISPAFWGNMMSLVFQKIN